jgi:hypothetical protein
MRRGRAGAMLVTRLILRVRVGWFTRTEVIPLSDGFYLIGPSQGHCVA